MDTESMKIDVKEKMNSARGTQQHKKVRNDTTNFSNYVSEMDIQNQQEMTTIDG